MAFGKDIAIDLGTTMVRVYTRGKGIVISEPTVVAMDRASGKLLKVGTEAESMLGRAPGNIAPIRPIRGGVISDYEMTEQTLRELLRKIGSLNLFKPRLMISVPSGISEVEERAVIDAGISAGARKVYLMEAVLAAAAGAGIDITPPEGHMVVDIGGGTTDTAVLSLSGIVQSSSIKVGGDAFNDAIIRYVKKKHNILIGERSAEDLKIDLGTAFPTDDATTTEVKGRCLLTGLPRSFAITGEEIREALEEPCERILDEIQSVLEQTPPELVSDVSNNGIILTGGGSLLRGMDKLISIRTEISASLAANPASCVALGCGKSLANLNEMADGVINLARKRQGY
ncbi:MAG: rod shape-determining protein [Oscillospiraceae bacterium]|jgi:rod shape-determining protein MreB|nr:rod shape-determining protein [Oscillospiraceae bacterium]